MTLEIAAEPGVKHTTPFVGTPRGVSLEAEERVGPDGKPIVTTKKYAADVGRTFVEVAGTSPSYEMKGDELYIRAIVTSDKPHPDPAFPKQVQQAWTQPVGWSVPK